MTDRAIIVLLAERVMGWNIPDWDIPEGWNPLESIADAWMMVEAVQKAHEGWRFGLLGGDRTMGYAARKDGHPRRKNGRFVVATESRVAFGWHAEFFGEVDPRKDYGQRHGEAYADTAPRAICLAALRALGVEVPA